MFHIPNQQHSPEEYLKNQMVQYYNLLMMSDLQSKTLPLSFANNNYLTQLMFANPQMAMNANYINYLKLMAASMSSTSKMNVNDFEQKNESSENFSLMNCNNKNYQVNSIKIYI
jgi:hypothetical protein